MFCWSLVRWCFWFMFNSLQGSLGEIKFRLSSQQQMADGSGVISGYFFYLSQKFVQWMLVIFPGKRRTRLVIWNSTSNTTIQMREIPCDVGGRHLHEWKSSKYSRAMHVLNIDFKDWQIYKEEQWILSKRLRLPFLPMTLCSGGKWCRRIQLMIQFPSCHPAICNPTQQDCVLFSPFVLGVENRGYSWFCIMEVAWWHGIEAAGLFFFVCFF